MQQVIGVSVVEGYYHCLLWHLAGLKSIPQLREADRTIVMAEKLQVLRKILWRDTQKLRVGHVRGDPMVKEDGSSTSELIERESKHSGRVWNHQ
jgi:hypothetical protein